MKKIRVFLLCISLLLIATACSSRFLGESASAVGLTDAECLFRINNTDNYKKLISSPVDINRFITGFDSNPYQPFGGKEYRLADVAERLRLECLRQKDDGTVYSVHKVRQGGLLYIFYQNAAPAEESAEPAYYARAWCWSKKTLQYADFSGVTKGTDIREVQKIDPATAIFIKRLEHFQGETDGGFAESRHYLLDGTLCLLYEETDGQYTVCDSLFDPHYQVLSFDSAASDWSGRAEVLPADRVWR